MIRRRPCQFCDVEVEVDAGVAVDEHHRRGRCALAATARDAHERAAVEAEEARRPTGPNLSTMRF